MEVVGVGIDIVEVDRMRRALERHPRLASRLFTAEEKLYCESRRHPHLHFAARFAAKEAALKALGTGLRGVSWIDLEVFRDELGRPHMRLSERAVARARSLGIDRIMLSLSMSRAQAVASALALKAG